MCNVLTNLMDTHVHGDVPTQEHASARGTFIQCWLWFRTAAVLRMGWRVPVLAQTLNTHFLIIVEYYCLIVQGYERGGLWLIHFHVVLYTAGSFLNRNVLNGNSDLRCVQPMGGRNYCWFDKCPEESVASSASLLNGLLTLELCRLSFCLSSDRKAAHVWVLACISKGDAINNWKHQSDLSLHWKAHFLKRDNFPRSCLKQMDESAGDHSSPVKTKNSSVVSLYPHP